MCNSNVFALKSGQEELLLEDVSHITVENGTVRLRTLFGEPMAVEGRIKEIDLMKNRIVLATN